MTTPARDVRRNAPHPIHRRKWYRVMASRWQMYLLVLPAVLTWLFSLPLRKCGWIKENDLKLDL